MRFLAARTLIPLLMSYVATLLVPAVRADQPSSAAELTAAAIDLETTNSDVVAAIEEFREGRDAQALKLLEQAVVSDPALPPAKVLLARLCLVAGRFAEGRKLLEEAAQASPGNPDVYALFGNIALAEGRATDALLHFERLQSLAADGSLPDSSTKKFRIRALAGRAAVAEVRRDWGAAESVLREWLASEESATAHNRLARARCLQGEVDDALAELKIASDLDPGLDPAETALGWLLTEAGDLEAAEARLKGATEDHTNDSRAWFGLANWMLGQERPDEAQEAVQRAQELDSESSRIRFLAAIIARLRGDSAIARELLEPLVANGPQEFGPANQLALILAGHPEPDQRQRALQIAEGNLRQHGAGSEVLATLGWVHLQAGRYREAAQALNQAISGGMLSPEAAYYLARLSLEQGQQAEAVRLLTAATAAPIGQFFSRKEARRLLEELTAEAPEPPASVKDSEPEAARADSSSVKKPPAAPKRQPGSGTKKDTGTR